MNARLRAARSPHSFEPDQVIRPSSIGAWTLYGLGSESENLPGFVSIAPSGGNGGPRNYGNAFLPAAYQGTAIGDPSASEITTSQSSGSHPPEMAMAATIRPNSE